MEIIIAKAAAQCGAVNEKQMQPLGSAMTRHLIDIDLADHPTGQPEENRLEPDLDTAEANRRRREIERERGSRLLPREWRQQK